MEPAKYSKSKIFKGAVWRFSFRLKREGDAIAPTEIIFTASNQAGGEEIFNISSGDSPVRITEDDENIWTVELSVSETESIEVGELYFQIDAIEDGARERWIIGSAKVYQNATA